MRRYQDGVESVPESYPTSPASERSPLPVRIRQYLNQQKPGRCSGGPSTETKTLLWQIETSNTNGRQNFNPPYLHSEASCSLTASPSFSHSCKLFYFLSLSHTHPHNHGSSYGRAVTSPQDGWLREFCIRRLHNHSCRQWTSRGAAPR